MLVDVELTEDVEDLLLALDAELPPHGPRLIHTASAEEWVEGSSFCVHHLA